VKTDTPAKRAELLLRSDNATTQRGCLNSHAVQVLEPHLLLIPWM